MKAAGWAIITATVAGAALADDAGDAAPARPSSVLNTVLTAEEARAELFGVHLSGVVASTAVKWSECIDPDGRTVFTLDGEDRSGVLAIRDNGEACFDYGDGANCFRVTRAPRGYIFWGAPRYETTEVRRDVEACFSGAPIG
ncbi:MAG: hypothetical protein AAFX03_13975 [Pseudomonadota bacterium]